MDIKSIQTFTSVKFPELKAHNKFLITQPDDKGFAQEQVDKLYQGMYLRSQMKLKPWEKNSFQNIYKSSGKSNHQILKNLKMKIKVNSSNSIASEDLSNKNKYYKDNVLKTINNSQEISKQILINSQVRRKFKQPSANIQTYTIQTKQICIDNMISDLIKIERKNMKKRINEYENALKNEIRHLDKDIFSFEQYTTNELFKRNLRSKYLNSIEATKKNLNEVMKNCSQEYHSLKADIPKTLKLINDKKIYVNFFHKLFGGEPELAECNLDDMDFQNMSEPELHSVTLMVESEMNKSKPEDNILLTSTDEELMGNINKIDLVFKFMEEKILKTLEKKEQLRNEILEIKEERENMQKEMEKKIHEREKEYKSVLQEYEAEKENGEEFVSLSKEEYIDFIRKLHIELFECVKDIDIKNKSDIDEYNIIDKIIKPTFCEIKEAERKIDSLIIEMGKYSKEDKELFNISVNKVKNENKILKFHQERYNRERANTLRNANILEKINKVMVTGKYKYKMQIPLNIIKKRRNNLKELKTEPSDIKLLYYK